MAWYKYGVEKDKTNKVAVFETDTPINVIFSDAYRCKAVEITYDSKKMETPIIVNKSISERPTKKMLKKATRKHKHIHKNHTLLRKLLKLDVNDVIPEDLYYDVASPLKFAYYLKALRRLTFE